LNYKNNIGLHIKLENSLCALLVKAQKFNVLSFQFFLTKESDNKYLKIDNTDLKNFLRITKNLNNLYIHNSYWINLCSGKNIGYQSSIKLLKKEIDLAKKLKIRNLILHPGASTHFKSIPQDPNGKLRGIDNLARALNLILKREHFINLYLENTAHKSSTIGSDLNDFILIKEKLDFPERIAYCIDFAHAFSYGYNIEKTEDFINLLDKTIGLKNIKLIHLNDSLEEKSSKKDKHELIGHGLIGENTLKNLTLHPKLIDLPVILELPNSPEKDIISCLQTVNSWGQPLQTEKFISLTQNK